MSVRKGDQDEGDLKVINASRELISYTYDRVADTNTFPKAQRWLIAKNIWDCVSGAHTEILQANAIRVENTTDAEQRLLFEKMAIGHIEALASLIDTCDIKGLISSERAEYWTSLVLAVEKPLKGWLKSDRSRYKKYLNKEFED